MGTDGFYAYTLDANGLQSTPVISNTGTVHSNSQIQNTYGQMKFNPCGTVVALAIGYQNTIEIFDFDPGSGIVSNPITIPMTDHVYGIEFAPNSDILYAGCYDPASTLVQFDISSHIATTIINSMVTLSSTPDIYGIQLTNNGDIYVCRSWSSFLGKIDDPDVMGTGCNYIDNGINLDPNSVGITSGLGLPGFVQSAFKSPEENCILNGITDSFSSEISIRSNPTNTEFSIKNMNNFSLIIFDELGRIIEELQTSEIENNFGKNYKPGIYFLKIFNSSKTKTVRLIKL
ncbi:MAG: T9SS type A sorting domain-containing protein [Bacteroidetes bacterium]|nr:T9SS type A sorting domain-containing protein [Bacteroidota bacterium]